MFVGHYAVSFAARSTSVSLPLWVWFVAVQWLDVVFMTLVLAGVEKLRLTEGFTESNDLDLYYMPYTHGLVGALVLSVVFAAIVAAVFPAGRRPLGFWLRGARELLPLAARPGHAHPRHAAARRRLHQGRARAVGPRRHRLSARARAPRPRGLALRPFGGRSSIGAAESPSWAFFAFMAAAQVYGTFGPIPGSPEAFAVSALAGYVLLAALAAWVERRAVEAHAR